MKPSLLSLYGRVVGSEVEPWEKGFSFPAAVNSGKCDLICLGAAGSQKDYCAGLTLKRLKI